jgi:hypothetical protein
MSECLLFLALRTAEPLGPPLRRRKPHPVATAAAHFYGEATRTDAMRRLLPALHGHGNADAWQFALNGSVERNVVANNLPIPPPLADRLPKRKDRSVPLVLDAGNACFQTWKHAGHGLMRCP